MNLPVHAGGAGWLRIIWLVVWRTFSRVLWFGLKATLGVILLMTFIWDFAEMSIAFDWIDNPGPLMLVAGLSQGTIAVFTDSLNLLLNDVEPTQLTETVIEPLSIKEFPDE